MTLCHTKEGVAEKFVETCRSAAAKIMKTPHEKTDGSVSPTYLYAEKNLILPR